MAKNISIQQRFAQLQKASERSEVGSKPKIQRVARHVVGDDTKLMSFGPIHYGAPKLQPEEQYKQMWASMFLSFTNQNPQNLHQKIIANVEGLKELFEADLFTGNDLFLKYSEQGFTSMDEMISWTLLVDGCALLQILEHADFFRPEKLNVKVEQLILVVEDVLLLENQLPFPLLKLLCRGTNEVELIQTMKFFLIRCDKCAATDRYEFEAPTHLLDLQRSIILYEKNRKYFETEIIRREKTENTEGYVMTYRNITELEAAGIKVKSSNTRSPRDISFSNGRLLSELKLAEIIVDDTTETCILNLIACEMCPDFEKDYGIRDYVSFLKSLIETPNDVKALRSARILINALGSDQDVLNLFTTVSRNLVSNMGNYAYVMVQIEKHYSNKLLATWIALTYHTYFRNPVGFLAATLGLILTFIQTWYSVHPKK